MSSVVYLDHISRDDVRNNRLVLFVFGDNDARRGRAGQAESMRGEPNARGIRVKKFPEMRTASFYTDDEYDENIRKISEDIEYFLPCGINDPLYPVIVVPSAGIGTGLAQLKTRAPRTAKFLDEILLMNGIKNGVKNGSTLS